MKIKIQNNKIELKPQDIKKLKPKFGFRGRRFDLQIDGEKWIKNLSLNDLISAVKKSAKKSGRDIHEIPKFLKTFHILRNKG